MTLRPDRSGAGLATVVGVVALATMASLATYLAVGRPLGPLSDVGIAAIGVLSAALAWRTRHRDAGPHLVAVVAASVGAAVTVVGSALVLSGATGFFLAGLVQSAGLALVGLWLIVFNRSSGVAAWSPRGTRNLGLLAGAVMAIGLVNVPGIVAGLDDMEAAPFWIRFAYLAWAGTFVLYPQAASTLATSPACSTTPTSPTGPCSGSSTTSPTTHDEARNAVLLQALR